MKGTEAALQQLNTVQGALLSKNGWLAANTWCELTDVNHHVFEPFIAAPYTDVL